ncbi:MAG: hypothetical protein MJ252_00365 [archaeon]|nr:hypothetical protein [archaeon]
MLTQEELKCPICKTQYNTNENIPKLLINCGHTVCNKCLETNQNFKCPEDQKEYEINSLNSFPVNQLILSLIKSLEIQKKETKEEDKMEESKEVSAVKTQPEELSSLLSKNNSELMSPSPDSQKRFLESIKKMTATATKKKNYDNCQIHSSRPLEIICLDDKIKICTNCALFGSHKGHQIISIEDFEKDISSKSELLINLFELIEDKFVENEEQKTFEKSKEDFELILKQTEEKEKNIKDSVSSFSNKLMEKIKKEEEAFISQINEKFETFKNKISSYKNFSTELKEKVLKWKTDVQNGLNVLNEITDLDAECIKFIELNDNHSQNGFSKFIENAHLINKDFDYMNKFPFDKLKEELGNLQINIDNKVLEQPFFNIVNDKGFNQIFTYSPFKDIIISPKKKVTPKNKLMYDKTLELSKFSNLGLGISGINMEEDYEPSPLIKETKINNENINVMNFKMSKNNINEFNPEAERYRSKTFREGNVNKISGKDLLMNNSSYLLNQKEIDLASISIPDANKENKTKNKSKEKDLRKSKELRKVKSKDVLSKDSKIKMNSKLFEENTSGTKPKSKSKSKKILSTLKRKDSKSPLKFNSFLSSNKNKANKIKEEFQKEKVNLSRDELGGEWSSYIAHLIMENKAKIKELKLNKCNIGDEGAIEIFKAIENCQCLSNFNIANNNLSSNSVDPFIMMLSKNKSLKTVYISNNNFNMQEKDKIKSHNKGSTSLEGAKIFI